MEAENVKSGADSMHRSSLINLEHAMEQLLTQVRNGVQVLEKDRSSIDQPKSQL